MQKLKLAILSLGTALFITVLAANAMAQQNPYMVGHTVAFNGHELSQYQKTKLSHTYGFAPVPGNYWYDAVSGQFGYMGHPPSGVMYPGHEFGEMQSNVSRGTSDVFVNGRELTIGEWMAYSDVLGYRIQQGDYWLDHEGNLGRKGNELAVANLYLLAAAQQQLASGDQRDNFWTSTISAGNSSGGSGYINAGGTFYSW